MLAYFSPLHLFWAAPPAAAGKPKTSARPRTARRDAGSRSALARALPADDRTTAVPAPSRRRWRFVGAFQPFYC